MGELISVIVPVYNVEKYLVRCINTLVKQTYNNLELILVDDGSTDNCAEICDELEKTDCRIKVYHKKNGGLSDARNYGVEKSNGAYITFVDSDDYVSADYIQRLYSLVKEYDAEIAVANFYKTQKNVFEYRKDGLPEIQLLTGIQACHRLFDEKTHVMLVTAWAGLIKSEIAKKYPFPAGRIHEDEATTAKYYYEANKVAVTDEVLYAYFQNANSITHTNRTNKNTDIIWAFNHRSLFFENLGEKELAKKSFSALFGYLAKDSILNNKRCDDDIKALLKGKKLTLKSSVYRIIYYCSPKLYKKLQRL